MVDHVQLSQVLTAFAANLVRAYDAQEILDLLCHQVAKALPVDGAGVMLFGEDGVLRFVAASDEVVRRIEGLQIELGEGPCLHAATAGEQVVLHDLAEDETFPVFARRALDAGLRAVYSFPMGLGLQEGVIGALNLYRADVDGWDDEDSTAGQLLADVATGYIVNARVVEEQTRLATQLQHALDSRIVIEQAKGKLSAQLGVGVDEAFDRLRRHARGRGEKIVVVAREIVDGTRTLE